MRGTSKTPLPNGPDVARQRRLRVRLYVNFFFSAYIEPPQTAFGQRIRYAFGAGMQALFGGFIRAQPRCKEKKPKRHTPFGVHALACPYPISALRAPNSALSQAALSGTKRHTPTGGIIEKQHHNSPGQFSPSFLRREKNLSGTRRCQPVRSGTTRSPIRQWRWRPPRVPSPINERNPAIPSPGGEGKGEGELHSGLSAIDT
jgi:hypothetical protein